jgi:hypothetical protein
MRSSRPSEVSVSDAQEVIYRYLLRLVKTEEPKLVLDVVNALLFEQRDDCDVGAAQALHSIVRNNDRQVFYFTLKRSSYILLNNWDSARLVEPIRAYVKLFDSEVVQRKSPIASVQRLRSWLAEFVGSPEYNDIRLFVARHDDDKSWSSRYAAYLLVPQYFDPRNPTEQREAARTVAEQLRRKFRFDLAMYVAHTQLNERQVRAGLPRPVTKPTANPTQLGDNALHLIKTIVMRKGAFSHENLSRIFVEQTRNLQYRDFKMALVRYLVFSVENRGFVQTVKAQLNQRLAILYNDLDMAKLDQSLQLRTCNRVIEFMTTEDGLEPSPLFSMLISQGGPLTVAIVLLKVVLICPMTRNRLDLCIANLIRYYEAIPQQDCEWFINFIEVFSVTFAIHVDGVRYDLVRVKFDEGKTGGDILDQYQVFSQNLPRVLSPENHDAQPSPEHFGDRADQPVADDRRQ